MPPIVDKLLYNSVLAQIISPCGNYLVAGNLYGHLAVYDLVAVISPDDNRKSNNSNTKPVFVFEVQTSEPVNSLASTSKFLLVGTVGEIIAYDWKSVITNKHPKVSWTIQIPSSKDSLEKVDVNALVAMEDTNISEDTLIAGCGDNQIHIFNLQDGRHIRSLNGHDDYLHSVSSAEWQLVSAGEDGTVCLWDLRQHSKTGEIKPHKNDTLARPRLGKWIGDAVISSDWLLCGGGPNLSLWHLRSMDMLTKYSDIQDNGIHVCRFYDDRILTGGTSPYFYNISISGDICAQIETSALTVYSAAFQETPYKVICLAGTSRKIDISTNFNYKDQELIFEEPSVSI